MPPEPRMSAAGASLHRHPERFPGVANTMAPGRPRVSDEMLADFGPIHRGGQKDTGVQLFQAVLCFLPPRSEPSEHHGGGTRSAFRGWTPAGEGRAALLLANLPGPSVTGTSSGLTRLDLGWFFQVVLYIFQQHVGGGRPSESALPA